MSDFLGRLAARALGVEPSLRPRVASRFEPEVGGVGGTDVLQNASGELSRATPAQAGPPPDLTPDPSPIAPPSTGRGAPPPSQAPPLSQRPSPPAPLPRERGEQARRASLPPLPGEGGAMGEGGRGGEVGRGNAPDTREVLWPAQPSQRLLIARAVDSSSLGGAGWDRGEASRGVASPGTIAPEAEIAVETRRLIPEHVVAPEGAPARDRKAPLLASPRSEPSPSPGGGTLRPESEMPPTASPGGGGLSRSAAEGRGGGASEPSPIRVTIGRIEVRAAAPAPPPAPRPAAGPRMNLEDYLRRRSEGRL